MAEGERRSGWKAVVCCLVLLRVVYWMSAPVTLWAWAKSADPQPFAPRLWCTVYEPFYGLLKGNR